MDHLKAVESLAALAQDSRLAVYRMLVQAGPEGIAAGELAERAGIPPNTLSFHLRGLMAAKLISQEKRGRALIYRADFERMNQLLSFLTHSCCGGKPCAVEPVEVTLVAAQRGRIS